MIFSSFVSFLFLRTYEMPVSLVSLGSLFQGTALEEISTPSLESWRAHALKFPGCSSVKEVSTCKVLRE
jgi:hypothetical protein